MAKKKYSSSWRGLIMGWLFRLNVGLDITGNSTFLPKMKYSMGFHGGLVK